MLPTTEIEGEMKGQQMWWDIYPDREKKKNDFFLYLKKKSKEQHYAMINHHYIEKMRVSEFHELQKN